MSRRENEDYGLLVEAAEARGMTVAEYREAAAAARAERAIDAIEWERGR